MLSRIPHDATPRSACTHACPLAPGEAIVDRRGFLSQAMLTAAAMALAACGGGGDGATAPSTIGSSLRVADYPGLAATGGVATASVNGTPLAIVRTGASSFAALSRVCPHQGNLVNPVSGGGFLCPGHGARFDATGRWTGGQNTSSLRSYPTTYDAATGLLAIG